MPVGSYCFLHKLPHLGTGIAIMSPKVSFPLSIESRFRRGIFGIGQRLELSRRIKILPRGVLFLSQSLDSK